MAQHVYSEHLADQFGGRGGPSPVAAGFLHTDSIPSKAVKHKRLGKGIRHVRAASLGLVLNRRVWDTAEVGEAVKHPQFVGYT